MNQDFLNELNEHQYAAVTHEDGPAIVIAGAGSGKTRVLTFRIAYLLSQGVSAYNILALTFTNKAAREMKERIVRQVGDTAARLWMGTFHSIFSRILRNEAERLGFSSNFTIYDASDSKSLIKAIIKEMGLDDKLYKPSRVAARISAAKNQLIWPEQYCNDPQIRRSDSDLSIGKLGEVYRLYMQRCKSSDAMDFDDLLLFTHLLFSEYEHVREHYARRFSYILVDEYQDTNYAQHQIVEQLTRGNNNICVVGDDAQSIYSFRGANIDNILRFQSQYEGAKLYKLERNYRSTQNIVGAANSIIAHNSRQIRKEVFSKKEEGELLVVTEAYSDLEEADLVAGRLKSWHRKEDVSYDEMAVLYRTNAQSRVFEEALRKHGLPYRIYGGLSFYQRKEVKDVLAYFRLTVNPHDEEAFKRVINYPARGIGATTIGRITAAAIEHQVSLWDIIGNLDNYDVPVGRAASKLQNFRALIESFIEEAKSTPAAVMGQYIIKHSGIFADISVDRSAENLSRQENVQEIVNAMSTFEADRREEVGDEMVLLSDYLSQVALLTDMDNEEDGQPRLTLMTVHAAKGLEFDGVCIVGMEDELFPNTNAMLSMREMEEERRLFYVAVTRAKRFCSLSYARHRFRYGQSIVCERSRFLDEIDVRYVSDPKHKANRAIRAVAPPQAAPVCHRPVPEQRKLTPVSAVTTAAKSAAKSPDVKVGSIIEHERFGIGEVTRLEMSGGSVKATVNFKHVGEKALLLSFARFEVIG